MADRGESLHLRNLCVHIKGSRMTRLPPVDPEDGLGPIDLDRVIIDREYRRALMLRLRSEAKAETPAESSAVPDQAPETRKD
jgi:hypothetical protein